MQVLQIILVGEETKTPNLRLQSLKVEVVEVALQPVTQTLKLDGIMAQIKAR